jgi:hypothetical protein
MLQVKYENIFSGEIYWNAKYFLTLTDMKICLDAVIDHETSHQIYM